MNLKDYRDKIGNLTKEELEKRDKYLRGLATGNIQGPKTGQMDIDKSWLQYYTIDDLDINAKKRTPYQCLVENNSANLDDIAIEYYDAKITYRQLFENIDRVEYSLREQGIVNGDVVSLCMPSTPETIYTFFALNKIGAIANMIDPRINSFQIKEFVNGVKSKMLFAIDLCSPKIDGIRKDLCTSKIISISATNSISNKLKFLNKIKNFFTMQKKPKKIAQSIDWNEFLKQGKSQSLPQIYEENKPAEIVYTTGTTGTPKGAILTNDNIVAMFNEKERGMKELTKGSSFLGIMPPFIAYGSIWGMLMPLMAGAKLIVVPKFEADKFADLIAKYKPNFVMGVPSFWERLIKSDKIKDLSFLKGPIAGGNAMTAASEEKINEFFKSKGAKVNILKGYGMTEFSSAFSYPIAESSNKSGSVGIPLSHNNIRVLKYDGELAKYGEKGEIYGAGPTVIKGYTKEEQNSRAFVSDKYGKTWVKTGDIGFVNDDGTLYITGREKRTIIRPDGHNVFPSEIEAVIAKHPAVDSCCVVGLPSLEYENGQLPTAYVVLKDEYKGKEQMLQEELEKFSLKFLQVRDIATQYRFIDEIPLIDGKQDYRKLEEIGKEELESKTR